MRKDSQSASVRKCLMDGGDCPPACKRDMDSLDGLLCAQCPVSDAEDLAIRAQLKEMKIDVGNLLSRS